MGARGIEVLLCPTERGLEIWEGQPRGEEDLGEAARRIAREQLGVDGHIEQLGAFGSLSDGISVYYFLLARPGALPPTQQAADGRALRWRDIRHPGTLRPVQEICQLASRRLRAEIEDGEIAFWLVDEEFTVSELRVVHETISGTPIDPSNFRKRVVRWVGDQRLLELEARKPTATRPARLYRHCA
jgi:8-oxo-dGTP diphosphatase